jgi:hypothetical protein
MRMWWIEPVARMGKLKNAHKISVRELEERDHFGDNIKMYFKINMTQGWDWIHLTRDRDKWWSLNTVMNL